MKAFSKKLKIFCGDEIVCLLRATPPTQNTCDSTYQEISFDHSLNVSPLLLFILCFAPRKIE